MLIFVLFVTFVVKLEQAKKFKSNHTTKHTKAHEGKNLVMFFVFFVTFVVKI
jgi:hypothetical protein